MKICIYGAGAIGSYIGGTLAEAGRDVSLIARGPHLAAMAQRGLTMSCSGERRTVPVRCTGEPADLGPQDLVIVTLKAHQAPGEADRLARHLLERDTVVIPAVNGIPWWYFHGVEGQWAQRRVTCVDPEGRLWDAIGPERVIGAVVYIGAEVTAPGVVDYAPDGVLYLGEPDGTPTRRLAAVHETLAAAGLRVKLRDDIRHDIWVKLLGNASLNPVTALTLASVRRVAEDPGSAAVLLRMMQETRAVGEAVGVTFRTSPEQVAAGAVKVGDRKSSMHQDIERGRPPEVDALVTAVAELGDLAGVDTPTIDTVLALIRLRSAARR